MILIVFILVMILKIKFIFFLECPKYTQQRNIPLQQFGAIDVPFQIDFKLVLGPVHTIRLALQV
jgi:hypothetical protein